MIGAYLVGNCCAENNYSYKDVCPAGDRFFDGINARVCREDGCFFKDRWAFAQCNCTSYASYRLNSVALIDFKNGHKGASWGDVKNWDDAARSIGITVNNNPLPSDIAY